MLMIWIKNSTDYIGVRYYSSSDNELVRNDCGYNIAMPAKHPDQNGYCVDLQEIFGVNDTNKTDEMEFLDFTEKFYNHHKVQIDRLETFTKKFSTHGSIRIIINKESCMNATARFAKY